jgi:hypothetical protein
MRIVILIAALVLFNAGIAIADNVATLPNGKAIWCDKNLPEGPITKRREDGSIEIIRERVTVAVVFEKNSALVHTIRIFYNSDGIFDGYDYKKETSEPISGFDVTGSYIKLRTPKVFNKFYSYFINRETLDLIATPYLYRSPADGVEILPCSLATPDDANNKIDQKISPLIVKKQEIKSNQLMKNKL